MEPLITYGRGATASGGAVWSAWITTSVSGSTSNSIILADWNALYASPSSVTTSNVIWKYWAQPCNATSGTAAVDTRVLIEREVHRQAEQMRAAEESALRRAQAQVRARSLLDSLLSGHQRKSLQDRSFFDLEIQAKDGARRIYRIHKGRSMNVDLLGANGKPVRKFCAHPGLYVPDEDTMVAQKLMLETDEEQFLRTANVREIA